MLENKILLITGGTGSFGNAVLQKAIHLNVSEIRIFSRDEKKQEEMRIRYANKKIKFIIGDIRNFDSIKNALTNVDYVFHAAALKQVPSCEFFPMEAVRTNILGTENVITASIEKKVKKLVLLSTDKAVYPINSMGISKAMAEKILISKSVQLSTNETILCATRYGNVMASRGSVIPLFYNQIINNKPITITDPKMTRFLMSLTESVELVFYAFRNAKQGDIFVQMAPASTILTLAKAISIILNKKLFINTIGTRHGEKLYETLISREEMAKAVFNGNYARIPADNRDLNYSLYINEGKNLITLADDYTSHNTIQLSQKKVIELLKNIDFIKEMAND